jgi:hypothetical protein
MAPLPPTLTFGQLYGDRANNPLGDDEEEIEEAFWVVYLEWRTTEGSPKVNLLEADVLADFAQPIGAVGILVADGHSKTGRIKVLHGFERNVRAEIDCKVNFCLKTMSRAHMCSLHISMPR